MALGVYCQLTLVASSRMCFEVNADGRHAVSTLHAGCLLGYVKRSIT